MKKEIKIIAGAKNQKISEEKNSSLKIWLNSKPIEGKANKELINLLSSYYDVPKCAIRIISGEKSRNKIVEIIEIDR